MKGKKFLHILIMGFLASVSAETTQLILLSSEGHEYKQSIDSDTTKLTIAQSDQTGYVISSIKNIENLSNLESIQLIHLGGIVDYSFLRKVTKLKSLYIEGCTVHDLSFIGGLRNLEYLHLGIYVPDKYIDQVRMTYIDLSKLQHLRFILFTCYSTTGLPLKIIPRFIHIKNKPFIALDNNQIDSLSDHDISLLNQYSIISLKNNPIINIPLEEKKLSGLKVLLKDSDIPPEKILNYYHEFEQ